MGVNLVTLLFGAKLLKYVPAAALNVVMKLVGILLCALAVELMLWGLPEMNDPNRNPTWKYSETTDAPKPPTH